MKGGDDDGNTVDLRPVVRDASGHRGNVGQVAPHWLLSSDRLRFDGSIIFLRGLAPQGNIG